MSKRVRGVIVWDFDGVLFYIKKYRDNYRTHLVKKGIPLRSILSVLRNLHEEKKHFSIRGFIHLLRRGGVRNVAKVVRRGFYHQLQKGAYYSKETDRLLHRMTHAGFLHYIVSAGHARYQYQKMLYGCGTAFRAHFKKTVVTTRPKHIALQKIQKRHQGVPLFFIDDTREHLRLAKKHIPGIIAIHYSNARGRSLRAIERTILKHAKA